MGLIEKGALADLVIAGGDPLTRIEDAAAVRLVIKNGEAHDIASLTAPFAGSAHAEIEPVRAMASTKAAFWWHEADYVESGRAACCVDGFCRTPTTGRRKFVAVEV